MYQRFRGCYVDLTLYQINYYYYDLFIPFSLLRTRQLHVDWSTCMFNFDMSRDWPGFVPVFL